MTLAERTAPGGDQTTRSLQQTTMRSIAGGGRRAWQTSFLASRAPGFAKQAVDWTRNRKLRRVSCAAVLVWWALVALRAREGLSGTFEPAHLQELEAELAPWAREVLPLGPRLDELAGAGLLALDASRRWTMPGWNPDEWGTGYPRGAARAGLPPCSRCHGARPAEPGRRSCRDCRERDRARWARRKEKENARRRAGEESATP